MTAPGERSWRHMIEDVGTTITLEAWDTKYKPNQDWNHAWGAAPANLLPRKVLGVEPLEPGMAKVMIWPRAGKLAWAKGKVPTVKGPIDVGWQRKPGEFRLAVELPPGVTATIAPTASALTSAPLAGARETQCQLRHPARFATRVSHPPRYVQICGGLRLSSILNCDGQGATVPGVVSPKLVRSHPFELGIS